MCRHPDAKANGGEGLEIESAHAIGKELTLTSDPEQMDAHGNDLFYDGRTKQTTLKGETLFIAALGPFVACLWVIFSPLRALRVGPSLIG